MKLRSFALALATLSIAAALQAEKITAGPKGGRLLEAEPHRAEFVVMPDRKVEITLYDGALKPIAPGQQVITITAEPTAGKTKLELEKTATGFVSKDPLPKGEPYRVVVQTRATAEAKPKNFRLDLNLAPCGECSRAEYACTCEGH